ncbi:sugar ABC transporter permease [Clostridium perfringens]|uniref:carbohydrate ABC transporter permease n=1 Tax=Clostridium perfringens TaxID=1502 RepID=UPI00240F7B89|nr:sugar ABC transporter permease [Clostridium perfringens]MDM0793174.1 sugar ABC transporter permease [Clostridium perfringens]WFD91467.1 sugar ABC transporter permease [Clostridium perfringens]
MRSKFKFKEKYKVSENLWAYAFIAPTIIGLIIINVIPFFDTIFLSFNKTGAFGKMTWAGVENYLKFFNDPTVWQATKNTIVYMLLSVPLGILLALIFAALLNSKIKGKSIYRAIYFLPIVVAPAAVAMVWKWLFNTDYGLINYLLSLVGIEGPSWLTNPTMAMISISIVTIWSSVGYDIILILAGLQGIPKTYYEAAKVDGASSIVQFFKITIPLVSPTLFFVLVLRVMAALKQFDFMYMLIGEGNPALEGTQTLTYLFYRHAFEIGDKGYASVIVLWTFLIIAMITAIQFKVQKKWVNYE